MTPDWRDADDWTAPRAAPRPRTWGDKFREAGRGVGLGVRGQASFSVHFFFATSAAAAALVLECGRFEWALLVLAAGLVLTAELLNSALETLFHGLDAETKGRLVGVLDIAAGAVLVASGAAAVVGLIVFVPKLFPGP